MYTERLEDLVRILIFQIVTPHISNKNRQQNGRK